MADLRVRRFWGLQIVGFTALEHKTQSVDQCVPGCAGFKPCPMGMECDMGGQYPGYAILFF